MDNLLVLSGKREYKALIKQCVELDRLCYDERYQGNIDSYNAFFDINSESFIFLFDKAANVVAGYLLFIPLKGKAYNELKSGKYIDVNLIRKEDAALLKIGINNVYVYSVIVNPDYRGRGLADTLVGEFMKQNKEREKKGILIDNILVDVINANLLDEFEEYNFNIIKRSTHNSYLLERDEYKEIEVIS